MKLKTSHVVMGFGALIAAVFAYGFFVGDVPGIPGFDTRTITVHTSLDASGLCVAPWIQVDSASTNPSMCTPQPYDPNSDVMIKAWQGSNIVTFTKINSCCGGCDVNDCFWGCGGVKYQTAILCLKPGSYKITAEWKGQVAEKTVVVT